MPPTKTEQHAYPYQQHLHRIEHSVNKFYENPLNLQDQLTESEKILASANRLHINITDAIAEEKLNVKS